MRNGHLHNQPSLFARFSSLSMETLGAAVTDAAGKVWPGYGLAEFTTVETDRRDPGAVGAASLLWEKPPGVKFWPAVPAG